MLTCELAPLLTPGQQITPADIPNLTVRQNLSEPSVYFDTWTYSDVAANGSLRERFVANLSKAGGTLAVSLLNLIEFSGLKNPKKIADISSFLREVHPNLAVVNSFFDMVIAREDRWFATGMGEDNPFLDSEALRQMAIAGRKSVDPFGVDTWITYLSGPEARDDANNFMREILNLVVQVRQKALTDDGTKKKLAEPAKGPPRPFLTKYLKENLRNLYIQSNYSAKETNHIRDLFHAVVPLAYCSHVTLDTAWIAMANAAKKRCDAAGLVGPIAATYGKDQLDALVSALR